MYQNHLNRGLKHKSSFDHGMKYLENLGQKITAFKSAPRIVLKTAVFHSALGLFPGTSVPDSNLGEVVRQPHSWFGK